MNTLALALAVSAAALGSTPRRTGPTSCATTISPDTRVYEITEVSEHPIARTVPKLSYPPEAQRLKIQGRVILTAVVNATGDIDSSSVTIAESADSLLDTEARRFVLAATLWPGCVNGQAVRVRIVVPVVFAERRPIIGFWTAFGIGVLGGVVGALATHHR